MKHVLATMGAGLLVTSLAACGSANTTAESSPSPTPTPTPTATATTAQFASVITEREQGWRDYEEDIVDCALASIGKSTIDDIKRTSCAYTVMTVTLTARQAVTELRLLPDPPDEVATLVERTVKALDVLAKNPAPTVCEVKESEVCDAAITRANGEIRPLIPILDAWKPYTR
ncbi:hypothetical protein ACIQTW_13170 [Paenarthrobacter sp. NPDC090517]|uniref:hypothetical protein n=1 Tax=Paenarthrobacter sp. NPDC090517 TaxID=3364381 RepID=UPI00382172F2